MKVNVTKKINAEEKTLIVAVDIGGKINMGYCRCSNGIETEPFEFFNNGKGFKKFMQSIFYMMNTYKMEKVIVGVESTGAYAEPLLHYLTKRNVKIVQVNPMHTKRLKELQDNSPNKTDKKDPKVIADIIEYGHFLSVIIPEGVSAELRRLYHARERSIGHRTSMINQLQNLVFLIFPEFIQIMKDVKTKSAQYILNNFTTPQNIIKLGLDSLEQVLKKQSRGRLGKERAEELFSAAKEFAGIYEGQESIVFEIRQLLSMIEAHTRFIIQVEKKMSGYLKQIPYSRFILSMKGIGEVTVAGLIGELGDFGKYRTISDVIKLAGLDLFEISSGKHKGKKRISKKGRPLLRKILYFASINVVRKGGVLHAQYRLHLDKGMPKMKALIAISRKLISIIFAIVRDHSIYIENYFNPKQKAA